MMSKASFLMQDQLRRNYSLVTDIFRPNAFIVRGRLPFPQGLAAISILFRHKYPADVYAHPYFVEKQSDPNQPSPQLHITEESQGIMKVMGGLRYMRDDNSKLDNTMFVVTDYNVNAVGRMLSLDWTGHAPGEHETSTAATPGEAKGAGTRIRAEVRHRATAAMSQHVASGLDVGTTDVFAGAADAPMHGQRGTLVGRTTFPTPEDSSSGRDVNAAFFQQVLNAARGSASATPGLAGRQHGEGSTPTFPVREGGFTVLYNPIETNEKSFIHMIRKLEEEERVVKAIVVPTRQSWRHIQLWADAFPDADIVSSEEIPIADAPKETGTHAAGYGSPVGTGGLQDFGNGVTGLSFPEVDLEAIAAEEKARAQSDDAARKESQRSGGVGKSTSRVARQRDGRVDEDPVDVLWESASQLVDPVGHAFVGLRAEDAGRVRVLRQEAQKSALKATEASTDVPFHHMVRLTPRIELHHVEGDAVADEYVLYDVHSGTLACTDLYHGTYADLDPVNSWMCRVWFKFMKAGNHKRIDIVPRFKWRQVCQQGTLTQVQDFVHRLTMTRPIWSLISAHGTPPQVSDAANVLRTQWGLPALSAAQFERVFATQRRAGASASSGGNGPVPPPTGHVDGLGAGTPLPPTTPPRFAVGDQLSGAELKDE